MHISKKDKEFLLFAMKKNELITSKKTKIKLTKNSPFYCQSLDEYGKEMEGKIKKIDYEEIIQTINNHFNSKEQFLNHLYLLEETFCYLVKWSNREVYVYRPKDIITAEFTSNKDAVVLLNN